MVDLQTAMAAAAADRQKRLDKTAAERKKRRSGADLGIERFDPVQHVAKEKAETASMWFVLALRRCGVAEPPHADGLGRPRGWISVVVPPHWDAHFPACTPPCRHARGLC